MPVPFRQPPLAYSKSQTRPLAEIYPRRGEVNSLTLPWVLQLSPQFFTSTDTAHLNPITTQLSPHLQQLGRVWCVSRRIWGARLVGAVPSLHSPPLAPNKPPWLLWQTLWRSLERGTVCLARR